ncbi:MAG: hypothetical protein KDJ27_20145 [Gammaproteobacteria bacterium]|nr:hypothetical protein [Gammaproteobacteria bacterium]
MTFHSGELLDFGKEDGTQECGGANAFGALLAAMPIPSGITFSRLIVR